MGKKKKNIENELACLSFGARTSSGTCALQTLHIFAVDTASSAMVGVRMPFAQQVACGWDSDCEEAMVRHYWFGLM